MSSSNYGTKQSMLRSFKIKLVKISAEFHINILVKDDSRIKLLTFHHSLLFLSEIKRTDLDKEDQVAEELNGS